MSEFSYYPPKSDFIGFNSDEDLLNKLSEWGFNKSVRKNVLYKDFGVQETVRIAGYEEYGKEGQFNTIVVEFPDGNLSCIHPAYLKEMQSSKFRKEPGFSDTEETGSEEETKEKATYKNPSSKKEKPTPKATKKSKFIKIELPTEKVHFSASVKEFGTVYNPFTESDDEIIILENVNIISEENLSLDKAWCSHSKTLKKLDLVEGNKIEFDAKVVDKKQKEILYKINNPSKNKIL